MSVAVLDTNVLIRLLTADPPKQAEAARKLFERVDTGEITLCLPDLILAETVYVLESFYTFEKQAIIAPLRNIVTSPGIVLENASVTLRTLAIYEEHHLAFADAYAAAIAEDKGIAAASFDKDFDKLKSVPRLNPQAL